jgi:large subunit ribosomal protein L17
MRHRKRGRQLGRNTKHRRVLFRNLVTSLLEYERIETTLPKAKEVRSITDKMIGLGKMGNLSARRQALAYLVKRDTVSKLFSDIAPRLSDRKGGYTRIIKTRTRLGDGARMAVIELTQLNIPRKTTKTETAKKETLQK